MRLNVTVVIFKYYGVCIAIICYGFIRKNNFAYIISCFIDSERSSLIRRVFVVARRINELRNYRVITCVDFSVVFVIYR